jgi:hypothetical protein
MQFTEFRSRRRILLCCPDPSERDVCLLDGRFVDAANRDAQLQLGRAGAPLALVLNKAVVSAPMRYLPLH